MLRSTREKREGGKIFSMVELGENRFGFSSDNEAKTIAAFYKTI